MGTNFFIEVHGKLFRISDVNGGSFVVKADGKPLRELVVGPKTTRNGWAEVVVDLSPFAGKTVKIELLNQANGWAFEFGYWGRIAVVSE